uniref:Uncharacterized protein n=1 Tax=Piliocolobus tephrosceles TaxID=591936 RepID=A0A8C9GBY8_9PRIM
MGPAVSVLATVEVRILSSQSLETQAPSFPVGTLQGAALKSQERPSWPQEMDGHRKRTEEGRAVAAFSADALRTGGRELEQTVSSDSASDLRQEHSLPQTSCVTGNAQTLGRDGEGCHHWSEWWDELEIVLDSRCKLFFNEGWSRAWAGFPCTGSWRSSWLCSRPGCGQ